MNQDEVILGVDTHLDMHVGAVISITGKLLATQAVETTASGYLRLLSWARSLGDLHRAGVEGTATYGSGLTKVLRDNGIEVFEVNRPDRASRRLRGKAPTDAEGAACAVLSARATAIPKEQSGAGMRCALCRSHAEARLKHGRRPSINYAEFLSAHRRTSANVYCVLKLKTV